MIDYILNYLQEKGVVINSREESNALERGITLYLEENGILLNETRRYFVKFVEDHLALIHKNDLKAYFMEYPIISQVKQIAIEREQDGFVSQNQVRKLYECMRRLNESELEDRYVPAVEIRNILGRYA